MSDTIVEALKHLRQQELFWGEKGMNCPPEEIPRYQLLQAIYGSAAMLALCMDILKDRVGAIERALSMVEEEQEVN